MGAKKPEQPQIGHKADVRPSVISRGQRFESNAKVGMLCFQPLEPRALSGAIQFGLGLLSKPVEIRRVSSPDPFSITAGGQALRGVLPDRFEHAKARCGIVCSEPNEAVVR